MTPKDGALSCVARVIQKTASVDTAGNDPGDCLGLSLQ